MAAKLHICLLYTSYLIAEYIVWMMKEKMGALKVYAGAIASITLILNIALLVVKKGWVDVYTRQGWHKHCCLSKCSIHAYVMS